MQDSKTILDNVMAAVDSCAMLAERSGRAREFEFDLYLLRREAELALRYRKSWLAEEVVDRAEKLRACMEGSDGGRNRELLAARPKVRVATATAGQ